jgi:flavorubredoxin
MTIQSTDFSKNLSLEAVVKHIEDFDALFMASPTNVSMFEVAKFIGKLSAHKDALKDISKDYQK